MKKRGLVITIILAIILLTLNAFLLLNEITISYKFLVERYVVEVPPVLAEVNLANFIFSVVTILLLLMVAGSYLNFVRSSKEEKIKINYKQITQNRKKSETDLDTLYNLVKERKKLSVQNVAVLFNISKEKALEWSRILEDHELVKIEYPAFSSPQIKIKEESEEEKENEKESEENKENKEEHEKERKQKTRHEKKAGGKTKVLQKRK